jgi:formimidoylglutamate deiminase
VPFHIHVAEQIREVEDCLRFSGKRPVEWLLENIGLNERFHLVHATHLTADETEKLAQSGANVVLCPSTEGNLGDGIFPLRRFQEAGGNWSLGTDSHIGLNPFEEIRLLDYGQRLISHKRNTFPQNSGEFAIEKAVVTGRKAMNNFEREFFSVGAPFDACIIDSDTPLLKNAEPKNRASTIVYTANTEHIIATFVSGKLIQTDERYGKIKEDFNACLKRVRQF